MYFLPYFSVLRKMLKIVIIMVVLARNCYNQPGLAVVRLDTSFKFHKIFLLEKSQQRNMEEEEENEWDFQSNGFMTP